MTASRPITGAQASAASGSIGIEMRMKPYVPSLSSTAARITEPCVGACVWASGSQVWNGNIGTLTPKPMNMPPKISNWLLRAMPAPAVSVSSRMSNVRRSSPVTGSLARKNSAKKPSSIRAEPNRV